MAYRFGDFELDSLGRSLALRGQGLSVQPKIFDLLAYLVRHAGRVVSKQELMEQLWPEVHVSEASLQRAVSLLRKTLREGDFEHALKSFAGHGYRFSVDQPDLRALLPAAEFEGPAHAAEARTAAAARDWSTVVEQLGGCAEHALSAQDYQLLAFALECLGRPGEALPPLRSAVERYEAARSRAAAAHCATTVAKIHLERVEPAVARGWLARAASLLTGEDNASDARAYLLWMQARYEAFEGRPEAALERAEQAAASAELGGSVPLRALTLGYVGFFNISAGRTRLGLEQQDHAAALAMSSAVDPVTGGLIYCNILWSCRCFADWSRGNQWVDGFEAWCKANFAGATGSCELHRAEVMGAKASLDEALVAVDSALAKLPTSEPWALGDAYRVRGDIRAAIGDLAAASSFDGWPSSAIHALVTEAEASLAPEDPGDGPSAIQFLSLARQLWTSIGVEHQAARVRLELARSLLARGDRAGALVELTCAEDSAKRAGARALSQDAARLVAGLGDSAVC